LSTGCEKNEKAGEGGVRKLAFGGVLLSEASADWEDDSFWKWD
jgi:hypothetical protein